MNRPLAKPELGCERKKETKKRKPHTITHKMITEPNFIILELISVIPALRLPNRIVSGIAWAR